MNKKKLLSLLVITMGIALGAIAVLTITGVLAFVEPSVAPPTGFEEPATEDSTGKLQEIIGTPNAVTTGTGNLFDYLRQIDTNEGGTPQAIAEDQTDEGKLQDLLGASATAADGKTIFNYLKKIDENLPSGGGLPHSGWDSCCNDSACGLTCPQTDFPNQDGDNYVALSYTDNGDGTVTDNITGLVWEQSGATSGKTWQQALQHCNGNVDGLPGIGWRLPNVKELQSIVNYSKDSPAIDQPPFTGTASGIYWSSTSCADYPGNAWFVFFGNGYVSTDYKSHDGYVRCVR